MQFYLLLTFLTVAIFALALAIWRKTRELAFPLGIGFLYYWSLFGAWSIVTDKLGGESGMHYEYLEQKMFSVKLDSNYAKSIILYGLFIAVIEVVVLVFALKGGEKNRHTLPRQISHAAVLYIAGAAGLLSYWIVRDSIELAAALNISAYAALRGANAEVPLLFTVHQLCTGIALVPTAIGFAVFCSGKKPRLLGGSATKRTGLAYLMVLSAMSTFCLILGMKNQLLFAGLAGLLFYVVNAERPKRFLLVGTALVGFVGLSLIDLLRGVPLPDLADAVRGVDTNDLVRALTLLGSSDEAFGAHLSMYGALSHNVPLTYGSSVVNLAASVIPRMFWPSRPQDIYVYYAERVGAEAGQGYTIHHATGWYLNFGILGVVLGAALFGYIWTRCFNRRVSARSNEGHWAYCLKVMAPTMIAAFVPSFIRAGPEAYKALVLEAICIPTVVIGFAARKRGASPIRRSVVRRSGAPVGTMVTTEDAT